MKKVFLSILAVAALASCVEDLGAGDAISFGAPFVGNTTKAADPSYGADKDVNGNTLEIPAVPLTKFNVYGTVQGSEGVVNIFNGDLVEGAVGENAWTCAKTQYWIPGATYNFAAVVDATVTPDANGMPAKLTTKAHTKAEAEADATKRYVEGFLKDMLYDTETTTGSEGHGAVNFAFEHLLAKAQFVVTSTTDGGYYYNVKGIKIHNFAQGTYTINGGTWGELTSVAYELGDILNVTAANTNQTNATQVLLIPTTADFNVEFVVELRNDMGTTDNVNDDALLREIHYTATALPADSKAEKMDPITVSTGLVKGHAYNFNLNLTAGSLIEFTVTKNPTWFDPSDNVNLGL